MPRWKINSLLVVIALIFGFNFVVAKAAFQYVDPRTVALLRVLSGTICFLPWIVQLWPKRGVPRRDLARLLFSGLLGIALNQLFFLLGLLRTTASHSSIIILSTPILTLLFSFFAGIEELTWKKMTGLLLSFFGVSLVVRIEKWSWTDRQMLGDLLTFLSTCSFSLYLIVVRPLIGKYSAKWISGCTFAMSVPFVLIISLDPASQQDWIHLPTSVWFELLYMTLGSTVIAYGLYAYLLRFTKPSHIVQNIFLQPILAVVGGAIFLNEKITLRIVVSGLLVLLGVAVTQLKVIPKRAHQLDAAVENIGP